MWSLGKVEVLGEAPRQALFYFLARYPEKRILGGGKLVFYDSEVTSRMHLHRSPVLVPIPRLGRGWAYILLTARYQRINSLPNTSELVQSPSSSPGIVDHLCAAKYM